MTTTQQPGPAGTEQRPGLAATSAVRMVWLLVLLAVLVVLGLLSIAVGTQFLELATVWRVLWTPDSSEAAIIVHDLRVPRTLLGILAGVALGLAGALIMALTRNPLADPGILGVNAGAQFAVVIAVSAFGLTTFHEYVWFSFAGAILATVAVYLIGSTGRGGGTPVRLTLAGVALGSVLSGVASGITLLNPRTFEVIRNWVAGSLVGRDLEIVGQLTPFVLVGVVMALSLARSLNAIALGDDLASSFGVDMRLTRTLGVIAVTILCGATTAVVGPISFVGLMVPHIARWLMGPDQRWIFVTTVVAAPSVLLLADIVGRLVIRPGEMQAGLVTAFIGAPVLIALVRRRKASGL